MNFIVDAHLPPRLCALLRSAGHDAVHTRDLAEGNRTADRAINQISLRDSRALITKDEDFFYSCILSGAPWKLVLVRTGNIGARDLVALFERNLPVLLAALADNTIVELDREAVQVIR
jgi:predicted nuclease of predicted toxin-antitoxin system